VRPAGLLVALLLLLGCGVPTDDAPRALDPAQAPGGVLETEAPEAQGPGRIALYFVRGDPERVVLQPRAVERSPTLEGLLGLLLEGPTQEQVAAGTRSAIPASLQVEDVDVGPGGVAVVTLGGDEAQVDTPLLGFAQIVATLTAPGRADAVRFRIDGQDLRVPRGDGSLTDAPVDRDDYADVLLLRPPQIGAASPSPA
jgi:spore germination protein GerM